MSRRDHEVRPTGGRFTDRGWYRRLDLIHGGRTFLRRRGLDLRWGGILVHRIDAADPGMDLHDHPWAFVSIVLRGGYTEEFCDTRLATGDLGERTWRRWSIHRMPLNIAHRITAVEPNTVTLVLRTRKTRRWGFYLPTGWVDWEAYDYAQRRPVSVESDRPEERMP